MVCSNLRLVVSIANHYRGKGLSLDDVVAEGNMGLIRPVEGFDPIFGTRFSTYASYWIRQSIRHALNACGSVARIPTYLSTILAKWNREKIGQRNETGVTPNDETVANRLGLTGRQFDAVRKALKVRESGKFQAPDFSERLGQRATPGRTSAPDSGMALGEEIGKALRFVGKLEVRESAGSCGMHSACIARKRKRSRKSASTSA